MEPRFRSVWISAIFFFLLAVGDSLRILKATDYNPHSHKFDYIIVGGGTSGCPLAATLSQNFKVLVIERGGSPYGNPNTTLLANFGVNFVNRGLDTPVQGFVSTDGVPNARARVLGGGTSINNGFYNRASPEEISKLGLDGSLANSSFEWVEKVVVFPIRVGENLQTGFRKSLLEAGVTPDNGVSIDFQVGTQTGASIFDAEGNRRPASDLLFAYANSDNLIVLLHAEVELVLLQGLKAVGVKYKDHAGEKHMVFLNDNLQSEVILSAGTLGSSQLLLLSGIGPAAELASLGIEVNVDVPGVGKNVSDNPTVSVTFPSPPPVDSGVGQVVGITSAGCYIESGSGPPMAALTGSDDKASIIEKVAGPLSMGQLVLRTLNVSDDPIVTFNYFSELQDLESCIAGVNVIEEVLLAKSFRKFVYSDQSLPSGGTIGAPNRRNPALKTTINVTIAEHCKNNVGTIYHYHGGCTKGLVLDSNYAVLGTHGLRVVDGSTFEFSPGTNPQATVMMLGRYVGVKILQERMTSNPDHQATQTHGSRVSE